MAELQGCKRSDGRGWRCGRPVADGRNYCEAHINQFQLRQKRQPVPDHLKLQRTTRTPKSDQHLVRKRKMKDLSLIDDVSGGPHKRVKNDVVDLKNGRMEIAPASFPVVEVGDAPVGKVGGPLVGTGFSRPIRSKNCEPVPIAVKKNLPCIREIVKVAAKKTININENIKKKKKIVRKCHWCGLTSFCILIMCLTCRENFFCEDCIDNRCYCKRSVERKCPVCEGQCSCKASTCRRGKPKQVKTKKKVTLASIPEKMSDFEKSQHLHMIRELLPVIAKMNQQKFIELDTEAKNQGTFHSKIEVQTVAYTDKKECRVCKACIPDVHRSCDFCSFVLCLACCHDIREGNLHSKLPDLKLVRSKRLKNKSWSFGSDGSISCPPKNLGGCNKGALHLTSFYPFALTKDLEESAKKILCDFKINGPSDSSSCPLCGETGLYFSTKQEFKNNNLEHFMKHWGEGRPIIIRDVFQAQPDLNWDFGIMLREYLNKCAESRNNTESGSVKATREWCEIEFGRKQIFSGGITQECKESLKFKLQFSSEFLQDHFPDHHSMILQSLPIQEYMNPFTGFMNLGAYSPLRTKNPNLGSYISISYGGLDSPAHSDLLSNLCFRPYDEVNILVHATNRPIRKKSLNELKTLIDKDNSHDRLEGMIAGTSRVDDAPLRLEGTSNHEVVLVSDETESESDDEDLSLDIDSCGAHWDIFRKEDVPMLLEFLKKYSGELTRSHSSQTKVVHPLFDDVFYLNDYHKMKLKEEFNVDALSFNQYTGEAVVIPAGCVYQTKRVKSCVHVVYEFMSPESALDSIKVSDEVRLLPLKYKARGNTVPVENTAILRMKASIEAMREVLVLQPEWSWPLIISHSAKLPSKFSIKGILIKLLEIFRIIKAAGKICSHVIRCFNWLDSFAESQRDGQQCLHSVYSPYILC
ncbi:lysine-specific demethylase JMJ28-like isoform X2 [Bidens hawaiensis]